LLSIIVGTAIVGQTLYSSTKEHLYEFATLRAMGATNDYIFKVIICQALINAVIGFIIAATIGIAIVYVTSKTALQVVIPQSLMAGLFLLTVAMCVVSALAAILRVIRVDPVVVLSQ
jgi:putative ABC transport system permease protein